MAPKNNSHWKDRLDCAEFASWLVFQTAATLYTCDRDFSDPSQADPYTGFWERDAKTQGQIISLEQAAQTPGAAVLHMLRPGPSDTL